MIVMRIMMIVTIVMMMIIIMIKVTDPGFNPSDIQPFKFGYGTGHYTQEFN